MDSTYNIVDAVESLLGTEEYEELRQRMRIVRLESVLSREDFYVFDLHLRAKVASALVEALAATESGR